MSLPLCATCKFWGAGPAVKDSKRLTEECESPLPDLWARVRPCGAVRFNDTYGSIDPATVKASVEDASGYFAALRTRDDFGCVLHEEKTL